MISFVLPTRDRGDMLCATLGRLDSIASELPVDAEVVVVDNASQVPAEHTAARALSSGALPTRFIRLDSNLGAAGRNAGVAAAINPWVVLLDDDSFPSDGNFLQGLRQQPSEVLAVMGDIRLPRVGTREAGGLPEVFIGCGVAIRRDAFLSAGGYDASFGYYAEEYDLAAKLLLMGGRVAFQPTLRIDHLKDATNRNFASILARLVRNNCWVVDRYAPMDQRRVRRRETLRRYREIARRENVMEGYTAGLRELRSSWRAQAAPPLRRPMPGPLFDRFTGLAEARRSLDAAWKRFGFRRARLVGEGKNAWAIRIALAELGVQEVREESSPRVEPDALVIGTLSPGPMLDAWERLRSGRLAAPVIVPAECFVPALPATRGEVDLRFAA
ncbi:MAG: glycosyltransferase [Planctomycetota bacterium]|nr:glycosyltransferase [Planctomycetota bacterium]